MNIIVYNIVPKLENNYSLLVSPIILFKATISISKKRTQPITNYIKLTKSSKPKRNKWNYLVLRIYKGIIYSNKRLYF